MDKDNRYFALGGVTSISLYLVVLVSIYYFILDSKTDIKNYVTKKDDFLEVSLVNKKASADKKDIIKSDKKKKAKKRPKKIEKIVEKKDPKAKPIKRVKPKEVAKKPIKAVEDTRRKKDPKKIVKKEKKPIKEAKKEPTKAELKIAEDKLIEKKKRKKALEALKAFDSLDDSDDSNGDLNSKDTTSASDIIDKTRIKKAKSSSHQGIVDNFRGGIQEHLQSKFNNETKYVQSGIYCTVKLYIKRDGRFSSKIVRYSRNKMFNAKVANFFKSLKRDEFDQFMSDFPKESGSRFSFAIKVYDEE